MQHDMLKCFLNKKFIPVIYKILLIKKFSIRNFQPILSFYHEIICNIFANPCPFYYTTDDMKSHFKSNLHL